MRKYKIIKTALNLTKCENMNNKLLKDDANMNKQILKETEKIAKLLLKETEKIKKQLFKESEKDNKKIIKETIKLKIKLLKEHKHISPINNMKSINQKKISVISPPQIINTLHTGVSVETQYNKINNYTELQKNNILKIQSNIRGYLQRKKYLNNNIINYIIKTLNNNEPAMTNLWIQIITILKKYPPQKNENKFIYGKLIENSIIQTLNKIFPKCIDLDKLCDIGSEYKNDCMIEFTSKINIKFSIKASKSTGMITIINKRHIQKHDIGKINFIICKISERKLYIFQNTKSIEDTYSKDDGAAMYYKNSLFSFLNKQSKNVYNFPNNTKIKDFENNIIPIIKEVNIYDTLYISLCDELSNY